MSIESDSDRLDIIRTLAGIATDSITVRHPEGRFDAVLDNEYYDAQFGDGPGVESSQPVLIARTIDVLRLVKDTPLQIGDEEYRLKSHQADGTGMSRVLLKR